MFATAPDQLASRDAVLSMSGLDFLRGILDGTLAHPPISQALGYRLTAAEAGSVTFTGTPEFAHCNPLGGVHGGWYGTLLDSCMACAVQSRLPVGSVYTTLEYKVNLIRAIPLGTEVEAVGTASHVGRSTGVAEGVLRGVADGRLFATGSTTCLVMTP